MRALVTGAGGFIGGHLVARLLQLGHSVRGVDRAPARHPLPGATPVTIADLRNDHDDLFRGVDVVFALAADMGGMGRISRDRSSLMRNNTLIDMATFESSANAGVERILFTSTACVYPHALQVARGRPLREDDAFPADPRDPYGFAKLFSEQALKEFAIDRGVAPRIARLHNVYGPYGTYSGGREKVPAALCRKIALAHSGEGVDIWGDGEQLRTFCFVDDCVDALISLAASEYADPVNIGSSELVSINELAQLIAGHAGKEIRINHVEGPEGVRARDCDSSLANRILGWRATTGLADGVGRTYDWISAELAGLRRT